MLTWFRGWVTGQQEPDKFLPEVYRDSRPLHDDWPPGFRWIPRKWTFYPFPMPAEKFAGSMEAAYIEVQAGYPGVPGVKKHFGYVANGGAFFYAKETGRDYWLAYDPVPKAGDWVVLGPYVPMLGRAIPAYIALSWLIPTWLPWAGGKRLHCNIGCKPDVTQGDNGWWFIDGSFTIVEVIEP